MQNQKDFSSYFPSIKLSIKNYSADYSTHNSVKISQNGTNLMPRVPSMSSHFEMMTILMSCMMTAFVLATEIVINSHWEPSLPNAPGKDKIWEEASPEAKRSGS